MGVILKVRKKGVIILPKRLREALNIEEGSEVIAYVVGDRLVLRALKPRIVDVDPEVVERILSEERGLERDRFRRLVSSGETGSRH
jgi:antitoxin MazE